MSVEQITPQTLTFEHIKAWDGQTMKRYLGSSPEMREAIYRIAVEQQQTQPIAEPIAEPESEEAKAAIKAAEEAEAARVSAETARVEAERKAAELAAAPKKIVVEYQATDEEGNPIGRPTHLEASTNEEIIAKMKEAHIQATRAFHRLKKQKVQSLKEVNSQTEPVVVPAKLSDAELIQAIKELKSDDPVKALEAHKRLTKAETDRIQAEANVKVAEANELRRQEQVSYKFLQDHKTDFNNCEANVKLIKEYFQENQLPWTSDNLEVAFHALESELAPVAVQAAPVTPANPVAPVTPTQTTPAAAAVVQPTPTAPAQTVTSANPTVAAPRPGVNGGIVPGQNSAVRPATTKPGLTMAEIHSWDGPTMRTKMRNPTLRAEIERVIAEAKIPSRR